MAAAWRIHAAAPAARHAGPFLAVICLRRTAAVGLALEPVSGGGL